MSVPAITGVVEGTLKPHPFEPSGTGRCRSCLQALDHRVHHGIAPVMPRPRTIRVVQALGSGRLHLGRRDDSDETVVPTHVTGQWKDLGAQAALGDLSVLKHSGFCAWCFPRGDGTGRGTTTAAPAKKKAAAPAAKPAPDNRTTSDVSIAAAEPAPPSPPARPPHHGLLRILVAEAARRSGTYTADVPDLLRKLDAVLDETGVAVTLELPRAWP